MKKKILLSILLVGFNSFAAVTTDCSQASKGLVTITSDSERLSMSRASELAYQCLISDSGRNAEVRSAKAAAINTARKENLRNCGRTGPALQVFSLKSWHGERPWVDEKGIARFSGEETTLVREPIECVVIGTGLFSGTVASVTVKLELLETFSTPMEVKGDSNQKIEVKLIGSVKDL